MNGAAFVANVEGLPVVASALTGVAGDVDVGQEVHFHLDQSIALTGFTAPTAHVERKAPDLIAAGAGLRCSGEEFPDWSKKAGIGRWVGSGGASDRALIDIDNFVKLVQSSDTLVSCRWLTPPMKVARHGGIKRVVDERGFSGARNAGDTGQKSYRNGDIKVVKVVARRPCNHELSIGIVLGALIGHIDPLGPAKVLAGDRFRCLKDLAQTALGYDSAAMNPGARTEVNDMISAADGFFVMLDHHHRVAEIAEVKKGIQQALVVTLMESDGGLVQDVHHADQSRADLRSQPDALGLSARQGLGSAIQR